MGNGRAENIKKLYAKRQKDRKQDEKKPET